MRAPYRTHAGPIDDSRIVRVMQGPMVNHSRYASVIADVSHLTRQFQRALDAAHRCGQPEQAGALINLHYRARGIAARLNQALADGNIAEDGE